MSIFGSKNKQGNLSCNFMHVDGLPGYTKGIAVSVTQEDSENRLSIAMRLSKKPPLYVLYNQITTVTILSEKEIIENSKSVLGRAAVGGLLLGPLGAIVGGMSGTGTKEKTETRYYFVINYHPGSEPNEIKAISFEIVGASLHWDSFMKKLKLKIPTKPEESTSPYL